MIFVFDIILLMPNTISKSLYVSMNNSIFVAENLWKSAIQTNKYMMYDWTYMPYWQWVRGSYILVWRPSDMEKYFFASEHTLCIYFSLWVLRFPTSIYNKLSIIECCHRIIWQRQSFRIPCTCLYQDNETQIGAGSSILLFWYRCSQSFVAS